MVSINPYLLFDGTCAEAMNHYKSVFGGEFATINRFGEMPDGNKLSEEEQNRIMHVSLPMSDGSILMASDCLPSQNGHIKGGDNFQLSVAAESEEEATNLFNALAEGGNVTMPLAKTFWGSFFGMLVDKYHIEWMINYDYPKETV